MIIEISIVVLIALICIFLQPEKILVLLAIILPIHGTIKTIVFGDGGNVFALWKEVAIIILFIKTSRIRVQEVYKYRNLYSLYIIFVLYCGVMISYSISREMVFIPNMKRIIFPTLIFLSVAKLHPTKTQIRNILLSFAIGSILINITGLIDFFSPLMRMSFRTIMKIGFVLDGNGNIYYDTSSFMIMGIERVCGLMSGGPNQMGVYNSFIVLCLILYIIYFESKNKINTILVYLILALSVFCLLTSFSRAGMAILVITFALYTLKSKHKLKVVYGIILSAILVFGISIIFPKIGFVIVSTLSGKEASAAARGSMTGDALRFVLENPLGGGVGASDRSNINNGFRYFAESSLLNITIDIGIIGFFLMSVLYQRIHSYIKNSKHNMLYIIGSTNIIAIYITSFVSVNPYETPYIYLAWSLLGLTACNIKKDQINSTNKLT